MKPKIRHSGEWEDLDDVLFLCHVLEHTISLSKGKKDIQRWLGIVRCDESDLRWARDDDKGTRAVKRFERLRNNYIAHQFGFGFSDEGRQRYDEWVGGLDNRCRELTEKAGYVTKTYGDGTVTYNLNRVRGKMIDKFLQEASAEEEMDDSGARQS